MKTIMWFLLVLSALSAAGEVIQGKIGQTATIKCGVNTYSKSLDWKRENTVILNVGGKNFITRKASTNLGERSLLKQTNLQINNVKAEDAGQFTCTADGKSQEHTLLVMSVSVKGDLQQGSSATLTCQVKGLKADPQVEWKKPDGSKQSGSNITLNPVVLSHAGTWVCMFSHAGMMYSESQVIKVEGLTTTTSTSQTSQTNSSSNIRVPPSMSNDASGVLGLSWWMWVAVGVGGLVVVFLMVFVIVLCRRIKRRKRRLLKIRNAAQPLKTRQYCQCEHPTAAEKPQQGRRREKPY